MTTTNLGDFGIRELQMAAESLTAAASNGWPEEFELNEVTLMMNQNSGNVFFTNAELQVCMEADGKLEMWYNTPYEGHEGFAEDLLQEFQDSEDPWHVEDVRYLNEIGILPDHDLNKWLGDHGYPVNEED